MHLNIILAFLYAMGPVESAVSDSRVYVEAKQQLCVWQAAVP